MKTYIKRNRGPQFNRLNLPINEEAVSNRLSDGDTWCARIAKFARVHDRDWDEQTIRFRVAVWSTHICELRVSLRIASIGTGFSDIQVRDIDTSVLPCVYAVTAKWRMP